MKRETILTLAAVTLLSVPAHAADPRLAAIKKEYTDVAAGIRAKAIVAKQLTTTEVVPGTGPQTHSFRFWARKDGSLAKVEVTYNVAAVDRYRSEYLYASGQLVFWLDRSIDLSECNGDHVQVMHETRVYWAEGKPIHFLTTRAYADASGPASCKKKLRIGATVEPISPVQERRIKRGEALARAAKGIFDRLTQNAPRRELNALMTRYKKLP
jgi:hypothetical protein